ncbi:MAG: hypothetical protein ACKVX7_19245 [Planctomycetota bacterium]
MATNNNSLMVVLDQHEYCFLYDRPSFPCLLTSLLDSPPTCDDTADELHLELAQEITRGLIGKAHQEL